MDLRPRTVDGLSEVTKGDQAATDRAEGIGTLPFLYLFFTNITFSDVNGIGAAVSLKAPCLSGGHRSERILRFSQIWSDLVR